MFLVRNNFIRHLTFFIFFIGLFFCSSITVLGGEEGVEVSTGMGCREVFSSSIIANVNKIRENNNAAALTENDVLMKIAQMKADDMAKRGYFSHDTPEGYTPWYWLDQAYFPYSDAGENLAISFNNAEDVTAAWVDSPEHRKNILNDVYTETGVGIAIGKYQGKETTFVVELYIKPLAERNEFAMTDVFRFWKESLYP